ncbi:MAG: aminotransferase class I/II-fold pyridoxal phosphate-dependent enzyme [candidate division WOR-3 bacterium]
MKEDHIDAAALKGKLGPNTAAVHSEHATEYKHKAVSCPIYQTSAFMFESAAAGAGLFKGETSGFIYTRIGNPTTEALQNTVAALEHGRAALATASGMAAISTLFLGLLRSGDRVVCSQAVYGPTRVLLERELSRFDITSTFIETSDTDAVRAALQSKPRLLFVETPSNPTLTVTDLPACAELAHSHGALLVVDNTFASPYLQTPLDLGADIVLHSMTKFINGHSDVVAGMLVFGDEAAYQQLRRALPTLGGTIDPHQAWLVLRGVKTLGLRVAQAQETARRIAEHLKAHPKVAWVSYPGLPDHPHHQRARRQMRGFGALICFGPKGGYPAVERILNSVKLCTLGVSLGGVETLIQHPATMTHASLTEDAKAAAGIGPDLIRLSVGIEDAEDLIADLDQALAQCEKTS